VLLKFSVLFHKFFHLQGLLALSTAGWQLQPSILRPGAGKNLPGGKRFSTPHPANSSNLFFSGTPSGQLIES